MMFNFVCLTSGTAGRNPLPENCTNVWPFAQILREIYGCKNNNQTTSASRGVAAGSLASGDRPRLGDTDYELSRKQLCVVLGSEYSGFDDTAPPEWRLDPAEVPRTPKN